MNDTLTENNKLRTRARRGMLEIDVVLQRFLQSPRFAALATPQLQQLEALLQLSDPDLLELLVYQQTPPADLADIIEVILS